MEESEEEGGVMEFEDEYSVPVTLERLRGAVSRISMLDAAVRNDNDFTFEEIEQLMVDIRVLASHGWHTLLRRNNSGVTGQ